MLASHEFRKLHHSQRNAGTCICLVSEIMRVDQQDTKREKTYARGGPISGNESKWSFFIWNRAR